MFKIRGSAAPFQVSDKYKQFTKAMPDYQIQPPIIHSGQFAGFIHVGPEVGTAPTCERPKRDTLQTPCWGLRDTSNNLQVQNPF